MIEPVLSLICCILAHADEPALVGPFKDHAPSATIQRTVVDWVDNLTVGAIQTTFGAGHIVVSVIANPIAGDALPKPRLNNVNQGQQIVIHDTVSFNGVGYSMGLFAIGPVAGGDMAVHEAGHSQQSAMLGPLYLPTVLLTYLKDTVSGGCFPFSCDNSFIERWADIEQENYAAMSFTKSIRAGFGSIRKDEVTLPLLVLDLVLDERFDDSDTDLRVQKFYEWLKTEIAVPLANTQGKLPLFFEVDLLKKSEFVDIDVARSLKVRMNFEQHYGHARYSPAIGAIRFDALSYGPGLGLNLPLNGKVQAFATVNGSATATTILPMDGTSAVLPAPASTLGLGVNVLAGVTVWDYATLYGRFGKEQLADAYLSQTTEIGLNNSYRSPHNALPDSLNYLDVGMKYEREEIETDTSSTTVRSLFLVLGGRF